MTDTLIEKTTPQDSTVFNSTAPTSTIDTQKTYQPIIIRREVDGKHFYYVKLANEPTEKFVPGVTTILHDTLPTPEILKQWLGDIGNEKAQEKLESAGKRGTTIHHACENLLQGKEVDLEEKDAHDVPIFSPLDQRCIAVGFVGWVNAFQPIITDPKHIEMIVYSQEGFGGTMDIVCTIGGEIWIVDIKTSKGVYEAHKLQLVAYQQAYFEMTGVKARLGILHLNPRLKKGYTFMDKMEIKGRELEFSDFHKVFEVYKMLNGGKVQEPPVREVYPRIINLYQKEVV